VTHDPRRQLVTLRCRVCEWQGERIESANADSDCPWCHAPTRRLRAVALGRLGIVEKGLARPGPSHAEGLQDMRPRLAADVAPDGREER